ncbi:MAG: response regulator [Anaerolineae bacterium]|nr:response regulator [Anaerolineae bacterium]
MSAELITVFSLGADATLLVFGAASLFVLLWQDYNRRSNLYFALCMSLFAAYGGTSMGWRIAQQANLEPEPTLYTVITFYVIGVVLLFNFVLTFAGLSPDFRHAERLLSLPLVLIFLGLLWSDYIYTDFEPLEGGSYHHAVTAWGVVWAFVGAGYMLAILWIVHRHTPSQVRDFAPPLLLITAGLIGFTLSHTLRESPYNAVMASLGIFLLGRVVINYQVFQPLRDLNHELEQRNEDLVTASRKKSQFLANMSHELRTPLNSIIGYTELFDQGIYGHLNETQLDRLQKITRNGRVLLALINDVLVLSRLEAGRFEMTPRTIDITALLDHYITEFRPSAQAKSLGLVRGYGKLPSVRADEEATRHILRNLIDNAIKFTDAGAVILRGHYDTNRHQVVITVADTGPGIDPNRHEKLFDVYLQAENIVVREHEGTGLGLAIAYRMAELNKGHLWFESVIGQGTTFYLALPAAEKLTKPQYVFEPTGRAKGPIILSIDDDHEALELLHDQLTSARYQAYGVINSDEGLKLAHDLKPALITLDVLMPDMDGWQVLEALRRDPVTREIPVLVISATDDAPRARAAGANEFIRKPADAQVLLNQIKALLDAARGRAETQELEQIKV